MISVVMNDGSILTCNKIEIYGNMLIADEYRRIPIYDVEMIVPTDSND